MTLIRNLFFLFAVTVFALTSTVLAVFNYDPFHSDKSVFLNFYISLFVGLAGVLSLALYYIKVKIAKSETVYNFFWPSVRQASFISLAITVILYLRGLRILDWLIGVSVVIVVGLLELFFESRKKRQVE